MTTGFPKPMQYGAGQANNFYTDCECKSDLKHQPCQHTLQGNSHVWKPFTCGHSKTVQRTRTSGNIMKQGRYYGAISAMSFTLFCVPCCPHPSHFFHVLTIN